MIPQEEEKQARSESVNDGRPVTGAMGRPRNTISPGRPRGNGRRGYWVAKREEQMAKRPNNSKRGVVPVTKDFNTRKPRFITD